MREWEWTAALLQGTIYDRPGIVRIAWNAAGWDELQAIAGRQRELEVPHRWLDTQQLRDLEPGIVPRIGALHEPRGACGEPERLLTELQRLCADAGVDVREESPVAGLVTSGGSAAGIQIGEDEVRSRAVLVAAGAWSACDWLPDDVRPDVRPATGQSIELTFEAAIPLRSILFANPGTVAPRSDGGRLAAGATLELDAGFDIACTQQGRDEVLAQVTRAVPAIADGRVTAHRCGPRPLTGDERAIAGPTLIDGLWLATGNYRNGILAAPLVARELASAITGVE
jgi:glycine oxidase